MHRDHVPALEVGGTHVGGHSVLFIGNSLTYTNDLPAVLAQIAKQSGDTIDAWYVVRASPGLDWLVLSSLVPSTVGRGLGPLARRVGTEVAEAEGLLTR